MHVIGALWHPRSTALINMLGVVEVTVHKSALLIIDFPLILMSEYVFRVG